MNNVQSKKYINLHISFITIILLLLGAPIFIPLKTLSANLGLTLPSFISLSWNFWNLLLYFVLAILLICTALFSIRSIVRQLSSPPLLLMIILILITLFMLNTIIGLLMITVICMTVLIAIILKVHFSSSLLLWVIISTATLQSLWGITQFSIQSNLNLQAIGETTIRNDINGVAKFTTSSNHNDSHKLIRAYALFKHPNSLAGIMAIAILSSFYLYLHYPNYRTPLQFTTPFIFIGMLTTFSRSAMLSLVISIFTFTIYARQKKIKSSILHVSSLIIIGTLAISVFMPILIDRFTDQSDLAPTERYSGYKQAINIISSNKIHSGVGPGNFSEALQDYLTSNNIRVSYWQIQPVHSVPILFTAEWGLLASVIVMTIILVTMVSYYKKTWILLLALLPLLLFDHYLLTQIIPLVFLIVFLVAVAEQSQLKSS